MVQTFRRHGILIVGTISGQRVQRLVPTDSPRGRLLEQFSRKP
jgi:hypothetical protein